MIFDWNFSQCLVSFCTRMFLNIESEFFSFFRNQFFANKTERRERFWIFVISEKVGRRPVPSAPLEIKCPQPSLTRSLSLCVMWYKYICAKKKNFTFFSNILPSLLRMLRIFFFFFSKCQPTLDANSIYYVIAM